MNLRSAIQSLKQAFVIGKGNRFLHGEQGLQEGAALRGAYGRAPEPELRQAPPASHSPQTSWTPDAPSPGPRNPWGEAAPAQGPYAPYGPQQPAYADPAYGYTQAPDPVPPQVPYGAGPYGAAGAHTGYAAPVPESAGAQEPRYQTQIHPESAARRRRSQQHASQGDTAPGGPDENIVPFPGVPQPVLEPRQVDAYVVNVSDAQAVRQAMSCLRDGHCTLVVIDQVADKAEIRRYVDMLTGACFALGGTMTRLSARVGFYIMAPAGMTVYTDPVTTSANAPPRAQGPDRPWAYAFDRSPGQPPPRPEYQPPQGPARPGPAPAASGFYGDEAAYYGREYSAAR